METLKRYLVSEIYEYEVLAPNPEAAREYCAEFMETEDTGATGCRFMDNAVEVSEISDTGAN